MKTFSNKQFYLFISMFIALIFSTVASLSLYITGRLALVEHHVFHVTANDGVGNIGCSVVRFSGIDTTHIAVTGILSYSSPGREVGEMFIQRRGLGSDGSSVITISSMGYIDYGQYSETVLNEKNPLGKVCQKGGGDIAKI